jgi:NAD(P)-dependent dehydrogenase (short-subunit alcohol dehydrogenase family)
MPDPKPLDGKLALITGGTRGIGRAVALKLGSLGAGVIVNYNRSVEDAEHVVAELEALGVKGTPMQANVGDLDDIHRLFDVVKQRFGGLDILVNCSTRSSSASAVSTSWSTAPRGACSGPAAPSPPCPTTCARPSR